ncbi:MAG: peptide ABC transporter substrate-binding protein [Clostridia bacterium]|nr:peptide ABC transporter substrate-binding protein [Clostridia bacterium]
MKRLACLLVACMLLCGLFGGCGDDGTGKGFRLPLAAEPAQLDPQMATDSAAITVVTALFEGLTRLDSTGQAVPGAADWTVSADGLTYTFTLKESYWSTLKLRGTETPWDDPVQVVADDFVYGLQRALSPETGAPAAKKLYAIAGARAVHEGKQPVDTLGVQAVSDTVLTITLTAPDEDFPAVLATPVCMPCSRAFFAYTGGRYGLEEEYLISNGAFWLTAWNHDASLLLYKNEQYHAADAIAPEAVRFVINAEETASALGTGALDVAALLPEQVTPARAAGATVVELEDTLRSLWFNASADPLSVPAIRQALRDSVEWGTVYTYLEKAGETPAVGYIPPAAVVTGNEVYRTPENQRPFTTRVEQAQAALRQGLAVLYPDKDNPKLPTVTVVAADDDVSANLARYIIQSWQKNLKLSVTLVTVPAAQLNKGMADGFYPGAEAVIYTHTPTGLTGAENLSLFATGGVGNRGGFTSKAVDTAVTAALRGGRSELEALESLLWEQCPTLPLSYPKRYYGIAPGVEGVTVRPFGGGVYGSPLAFYEAKKWD